MPRATAARMSSGVPTPHEVVRAIGGQQRHRLLDHRQHHLLRLADCEPADGVALEFHRGHHPRAFRPQRRHVAALHDAEQGTAWLGEFEGALGAFGPAQRQAHRPLDLCRLGRQTHAFVELHGDVGAEQILDLDGALRRQLDGGAIDVRAEYDAAFVDLTQRSQRHHLKAAGIGQDRISPPGEAMQATERGDALGAGAQHQMIGVAEHDVGAGVAQLVPVHPLHGALRSDRHECRRAYDPVRRRQLSPAVRFRRFRTGETKMCLSYGMIDHEWPVRMIALPMASMNLSDWNFRFGLFWTTLAYLSTQS